MATDTLQAPIPPIVIVPGMELRLEAIDASTGDPVTDVVATNWAIYGDSPSLIVIEDGEIPAWVASGDEDEA